MSLFGNLFEEDDKEHGIQNEDGVSASNSPGGNVPSSPRLSHQLCGIYNQGATCYLNSLLQTLAMTPEFRELLFQLELKELGNLSEKHIPGSKVRIIPIHLQQLFSRLLLLNVHAVNTSELTDSFGWNNNETRDQHDVQELNRILFSAIEASLVGTSGQNLIHSLYHGTLVNQIRCEECKNTSEREEDFLDLCVTVSGCSSLQDSLSQTYVEKERLDDSNKYQCSVCCKLTTATKGAKLRHLPPILTISLLRFNFDYVKMERFKETSKFTFPTEIDMAEYCDKPGTDTMYDLYSIVIHRGSTHGGHYHAYIRDVDNLGEWSHPEKDEISILPDANSGEIDVIDCNSCHSLLKLIIQRYGKNGMMLDTLCAELEKQTGVSWNKRFKKQYGPIAKFLAANSDQFVYNPDARWVSLNAQPMPSKEAEVTNGGSVQSCSTAVDETKQKRIQNETPPPGHCWFNFDDIHVNPITSADIEKQFMGKESAYMLFFRRRSLSRPAEAHGNPSFGVPQRLVAEIESENSELEKLRNVYQQQLNDVKIEIHFGRSYRYIDGALRPEHNKCVFVELSIDRRKTVMDLLSAINEEINEELIGDQCIIHIAKEVPAGLHLYQNITADMSATLVSYGVGKGSKLFLWDGQQVSGYSIGTGAACEPVLLTITLSGTQQFSCGFAKNMSIRQLKDILCERYCIMESSIHLICQEQRDCSIKGNLEDSKTLAECNLDDCSQLNVMVPNCVRELKCNAEFQSAPIMKSCLSFHVENHCSTNFSDDASALPIRIEVSEDSTVEELKAIVLSQLDMNDAGEATRLVNLECPMGKLPLQENVSLRDAHLLDGTHLAIEPEYPLLPNQIVLFVSIVVMAKDSLRIELTVDKTVKIADLLQLIIEKAGLDNDEWHLRRMDWCGEPAEMVDDLDATLHHCRINHGDCLSLQPGKLPPKGFLKMFVYLLPNIVGVGDASPHNVNSSTGSLDPLSLGSIIISKQASLLELKQQIMTLDGLSEFFVPTPFFLRLCLLHSRKPTSILKLHTQLLQKLKLVNGTDIGVQILSDEEDLSLNQMLLLTRLRLQNERSYLPAQELIWETSQGASFASLRRTIANHFKTTETSLYIAKHFPEKYEWVVLQDTNKVEQKSSVQRKKKNYRSTVTNRSDIRQAPYHVKDGDVIGIKMLPEGSQVHGYDFSTPEDDIGVERLKQESEIIRKKREENMASSNASSFGQSKSKPELAIKIHVDNF